MSFVPITVKKSGLIGYTDFPVKWSQLSIAIKVFKPMFLAPARKSVAIPTADDAGMINQSNSPSRIPLGKRQSNCVRLKQRPRNVRRGLMKYMRVTQLSRVFPSRRLTLWRKSFIAKNGPMFDEKNLVSGRNWRANLNLNVDDFDRMAT